MLRTLDRIEDVMDRDKLLPWLLSLSVSSAGGESGSLMLHDPLADDLYIAAAMGLTPATLQSVRQGLGQGIAGRVALSRRPELVHGPQPESAGRERGEIVCALCVPLLHGDELMGVLNVNAAAGGPPFGPDDLAELTDVADHVSRILHGAAGTLQDRARGLRKRLGREFRDLADSGTDLEVVLAGWSATLAMELGAAYAALAVVRGDGTLLLAEGTSTGETRVGGIPQRHPAWNEVLQTARPVLAREAGQDGGLSLFFLPLGRKPVRAVLAVSFDADADAYRFQELTRGVVELLESHLPELLRRCEQQDRDTRLRELATRLAHLQAHAPGADAREELVAALRTLTGAREVRFLDDTAPADATTDFARELLERAGETGWLVASVAPGEEESGDRTCLVVRTPGARNDGLLLLGKDRCHPVDSTAFTDFDAVLAGHLAPLTASGAPDRPAPPAPPPAPVPESLLDVLAREIDRADRYHAAFSLSAFEYDPGVALGEAQFGELRARLRVSDQIFPDGGGLLFVVAPEEINAVAALERRTADALREVAGDPRLVVRTGHALYPGRDASPEALVDSAKRALSVRSRDGD